MQNAELQGLLETREPCALKGASTVRGGAVRKGLAEIPSERFLTGQRINSTSLAAYSTKGVWMYLYRAVDSQGSTLEFWLSSTRDAQAAKRFFAKALHASHTVTLRVITVDKNAAYPKALKEMQAAGDLAVSCELRQSKYLNNLVEQDHRFIKRLVKPGLGFFSFETARKTLQGYEIMNMMRKGQVQGVKRGDSSRQAAFIAELFGVAI